MKAMILGILIIISISGFAAADCDYVVYEKTYVDPDVIDLYEKKIKITRVGEVYQTSAIYSDANGLYYQDYLESHEQPTTMQKIVTF